MCADAAEAAVAVAEAAVAVADFII